MDEDVYRLEPGRAAQPAARSSVHDSSPALSPDGRRFAFCSTRSGDAVEVWTAAVDGSEPRQLTHGSGSWKCSPTWSPDGQQIAFHSQTDDGEWHIWTIDVDGGIPRRITNEPGKQNMPTWSRDGHWIYFSWDQGTGREIWRTHLQRGTKEQVTHGGGGLVGRESADGQSVLYEPKTANAALLAQPLTGGAPRTILPCVTGTAYAVTTSGIYYVACQAGSPPEPNAPVHVLNPVTGVDRRVGTLEHYQYENMPSGFAVSADGRTILYTRLVSIGADLMLIENFR